MGYGRLVVRPSLGIVSQKVWSCLFLEDGFFFDVMFFCGVFMFSSPASDDAAVHT